jgi:hypothetical protein
MKNNLEGKLRLVNKLMKLKGINMDEEFEKKFLWETAAKIFVEFTLIENLQSSENDAVRAIELAEELIKQLKLRGDK